MATYVWLKADPVPETQKGCIVNALLPAQIPVPVSVMAETGVTALAYPTTMVTFAAAGAKIKLALLPFIVAVAVSRLLCQKLVAEAWSARICVNASG